MVTKSVDDVSRMNSSPSNAHERRASSELVIRFLIDLCSASHLAWQTKHLIAQTMSILFICGGHSVLELQRPVRWKQWNNGHCNSAVCWVAFQNVSQNSDCFHRILIHFMNQSKYKHKKIKNLYKIYKNYIYIKNYVYIVGITLLYCFYYYKDAL